MKLSVLQWNVWYKENPIYIAKQIKKLNPDVICAQELIQNSLPTAGFDTAQKIAQLVGYNYYYEQSCTWDNKNDKTAQGNAIFSKYHLLNTQSYFLKAYQHNPFDASAEGRIYIEVTLKVDSKKITIGTTHLSYSPKFVITKNRKKEVDNLVKIVQKHKSSYILTGDFNSTPDSYTVKSISKYLKNAGPDFNEKTWTTKPFNYHNFIETNLDWRLDYIFTTPDIKVVSSKIVKTKYSDHLPILIVIEV